MNDDTISRAALLQDIKRRRNQATIGKTEARRWEKIVEAFPAAQGATPAPPPASDDPVPDILMFIGRFSTDGQGTRWEVVEAFTQGGCFWFSYILAARFGQQYGAEIVTDYVANHFAARIAGRVYDITGDVTDAGKWEQWVECNDALLRQRIIDDCIMF